MRKWTWSGLVILLAAVIFSAIVQIEQAALLLFIAAIIALIPFFLAYEQKKPKPRDLMPIVVLAAISVAGRIIFSAFPNFKPVTAIVIIGGMAFGAESGFMIGALSGLASNLFFGQGPWTAWQMLAWGLIGYIAGILSEKQLLNKSWQVLSYGILASFGFGLLMDTWTAFGFVQPITLPTVLAKYALGLPFNISHAISTLIFLLPIYRPWLRQLQRIKRKFDLS